MNSLYVDDWHVSRKNLFVYTVILEIKQWAKTDNIGILIYALLLRVRESNFHQLNEED